MCRAPAPTLAMGCASGSVSQPRRGRARSTPRATFEETPAIPSTDALEAGNSQKLMPGFQGAQEKTGTEASLWSSNCHHPSQTFGPIAADQWCVCINFAQPGRCAHDLRMTRACSIFAAFAAALLLLPGPGLPGARSQPGPAAMELLQIAEGVFVHLGAMAMISWENEAPPPTSDSLSGRMRSRSSIPAAVNGKANGSWLRSGPSPPSRFAT